jgi:hypothetical protein
MKLQIFLNPFYSIIEKPDNKEYGDSLIFNDKQDYDVVLQSFDKDIDVNYKKLSWICSGMINYIFKRLVNYIPFVRKIGIKEFTNILDENSNVLLTANFFLFKRRIYNERYLNAIRHVKGKKILYIDDFVFFSSNRKMMKKDFLPAFLSLINSDVFDAVLSYDKTATEFCSRIIYQPFPLNRSFEYLDNLVTKILDSDDTKRLYAPNKYQLSSFGNVVEGSQKEKYLPEILKKLSDTNVNFGVYFNSKNEQISSYNNLPNYSSNQIIGGNFINRIVNTRCVFHISEEDYLSPSHLEAVYFDKLLLTNSPCVMEENWYDPEFVRVYDSENFTQDDIDWLKRKVDVRYTHKEDLAIEHFLDRIDESANLSNL